MVYLHEALHSNSLIPAPLLVDTVDTIWDSSLKLSNPSPSPISIVDTIWDSTLKLCILSPLLIDTVDDVWGSTLKLCILSLSADRYSRCCFSVMLTVGSSRISSFTNQFCTYFS